MKYLSLSLLWGISVLLSMNTESASIPETSSSSNSTAEPNKTTTRQPNAPDLSHNETETLQEPFIGAVSTDTTVSPTMETQEANVSGQRDDSNVTATGLVAAAATASTLPSMLTSASETQTSRNRMTSETAEPTDNQQSRTISAETAAPATTSAVMSASHAASSETAARFSPQPVSTTESEVTATLSSSTSSDHLTQAPHYIHTLSTTSATTSTNQTTNHTTEAAPVFHSTSLPLTTKEATTITQPPSTSQPISLTQTHASESKVPDTTGTRSIITESPTTPVSTDSAASTTPFSTSPAGGGIPRVPKGLSNITTKATTTATSAPCDVSHNLATTEGQTCSVRGVVNHCLIIIAALAGLATIFLVSTIVLCTKLSGKKYKVRKAQRGTEMMCISSLLPERNQPYTRQRNPIHNGVLVIPTCGDSDDDGGDNLTLSSFLPENDRIVY